MGSLHHQDRSHLVNGQLISALEERVLMHRSTVPVNTDESAVDEERGNVILKLKKRTNNFRLTASMRTLIKKKAGAHG